MKQFGYIILLILILCDFKVSASEKDTLKSSKLNPEYIADYKDLLTARFYLLSESICFTINPTNFGKEINYRPNIDIKNGIAGFYKWFGLGLAVKNPFSSNKNDIKGKSKVIDLRINAYGNAIAAELSFQDYRHFYIENADDIFQSWNTGDKYPQRPDMHIFSTSAILYYIFNYKKHSIRASYIQNERQKKSSGSIMLMPSFIYLKLSADSSIIPQTIIDKYNIDPNEQIIKGVFFTYGLSAGYSYTVVFLKYFYINFSFIPGMFLQTYKYDTEEGVNKSEEVSLLWLSRGALGYNSDKFYVGIGGVFGFNASPVQIGEANFNYNMNQIRFWIGTRFDVFKKKKKN
ncbi:MAG: DUF4421 family protein [Bacteroidales bacterium]|nr:DUF4421 family protein [Bacteroidales bacterium]